MEEFLDWLRHQNICPSRQAVEPYGSYTEPLSSGSRAVSIVGMCGYE